MDIKKVLEVIKKYQNYFDENSIPSQFFPTNQFPKNDEEYLAYLHWMTDEIEKLINQDEIEKAMRWLGFIQGCLWKVEIFTIDQLKSHNRSK